MKNNGFNYHLCDHAKQRWSERFVGIDPIIEFESADRVGKKTLKRIRELSPVSSGKYLNGRYNGRHCLLGQSGIVFVISDDCIVTVFHLHSDI